MIQGFYSKSCSDNTGSPWINMTDICPHQEGEAEKVNKNDGKKTVDLQATEDAPRLPK